MIFYTHSIYLYKYMHVRKRIQAFVHGSSFYITSWDLKQDSINSLSLLTFIIKLKMIENDIF